ncbi:MAG: branched-chain amino acid ABC transporter permease, partial [Nocardioides sp.]
MDFVTLLGDSLQQAIGPAAVVYCLAAIGLNIQFGYTGLLNFGQAAFMAVGGYTMASFVSTWGLSFWLGIVAGLFMTAVLALLLGVPTLRLRADYLAIVTIAAAEIVRQVVGSVSLLEYFGGQDGLQAFSKTFRSYNPFTEKVEIGTLVSWSANDAWV